MNTRMFTSTFILILAVLIIAGGCATDKMAYISKEYEIYGTWINPDAKPVLQKGKIVIYPEGKMELYNTSESKSYGQPEFFIVTNKWIDSTGDIWYTLIVDWGSFYHGPDYWLCKISDSGKTLEVTVSNSDYPKKIDQTTEYHILYRKE